MVKMAVYGIGIDLIRSDRLGKTLTRWGDRFTRRVFTPAELAACAGRRKQVACLATRFAAKEAFVKALGTGIRSPVVWSDIQVQNDDLGKPEICPFLTCPRVLHESWDSILAFEPDRRWRLWRRSGGFGNLNRKE